MTHAAEEVLLLLLIGCLVGMSARRYKLPYTLALVVAGIALGFVGPEQLQAFELSADLLFTFLLPPLLFEAALHVDLREFRRDARSIGLLAVVGVALATAATAALAWAGLNATGLRPGFGWGEAFLFGSVIAATDPISVLALFRELGVGRRLYMLVEGESLLNDGVAVVLFLIVAAVLGIEIGHGGHGPHLEHTTDVVVYALRTFGWMAGGGVLLGTVVGGLAATFMRAIDDHLVEITVTTVVAYGSFLMAEELHCSGVLSTVVAGVVMGSFGTRFGMSTRTRLAVEDFWTYAAFVANTLVFLLLGVELEIEAFVADGLPILIAFAATLIGRAIVIYPVVGISGIISSHPIPSGWGHVLWWGGLRGSLSMVLVLGLPYDFPARELLVHLVFGVVSASLFLQGLTVGPLLARLGLTPTKSEAAQRIERHRARQIAAGHALHTVHELVEEGVLGKPAAHRIERWYSDRHDAAAADLADALGEEGSILEQEIAAGLLEVLDKERAALREALHAGIVGDKATADLIEELDERAAALREALHDGHDLGEAIDTVLSER